MREEGCRSIAKLQRLEEVSCITVAIKGGGNQIAVAGSRFLRGVAEKSDAKG